MRKNRVMGKFKFSYIILILIIAVVVSSVLVSNVFARFSETSTGMGTVKIANWSCYASVDDETETLVIDLGSTCDPNELVENGYIAPGTAGYVPVYVDASESNVAMSVNVSATFGADFPSYVTFTDNMGKALTKTTSGTSTVISYTYYFSVSELNEWETKEGDGTMLVDLGFRWAWDEEQGSGSASGTTTTITLAVTGTQITSVGSIGAMTKVNFVAAATEISTAANTRNILLNDVTAINIASFDNNFELDFNGFAVGGDSAISTDSEVTIYLGTSRGYEANAGSFNNLTLTAPNATIYQYANLVGNVTVSSGNNSYYFSGKFVESAASTIEVSPTVVASGTAGKITVKGGRLVVKQTAVARTVAPKVEIKQTTADTTANAATKPVVIVVEKAAEVSELKITSVADTTATKAVTITNNGTVATISNELDELTENTPSVAITNNGTVNELANTTAAELTLDVTNNGEVESIVNGEDSTAAITLTNNGTVDTIENKSEAPTSAIVIDEESQGEIADTSIKVSSYTQFCNALTTIGNTKGSIKLDSDIESENALILTQGDITLDLNGYTLTRNIKSGAATERGALIISGGAKLVVADSSTSGTGMIYGHTDGATSRAIIITDGEVIVNSGTIKADYASFYIYGNYNYTTFNTPTISSLTLNGGKIISPDTYNCVIVLGNGAKFIMNGGEVDGAISGNGNCDSTKNINYGGTYIEINGGTIDTGTSNFPCFYLPQQGIVNINDGSFRGSEVISMKDGILNISGGTFISYGEMIDPAASNNNGSEDTGACISITSNPGYIKDANSDPYMQINISGGSFTGKNGYAFYEGIAHKDNAPIVDHPLISKINITGGTFVGFDGAASSYDIYLATITGAASAVDLTVKPTAGDIAIIAVTQGEKDWLDANDTNVNAYNLYDVA